MYTREHRSVPEPARSNPYPGTREIFHAFSRFHSLNDDVSAESLQSTTAIRIQWDSSAAAAAADPFSRGERELL